MMIDVNPTLQGIYGTYKSKIDTGIMIAYNKSTKKHTIFCMKRGVKNVSSKEHGCKRKF